MTKADKIFKEIKDHRLFVGIEFGYFDVTVETPFNHTHILQDDKSLEETLREALAWLNKQEEEK